MELAPCAARSLGWAQSVGTVTVGVPCRLAHLMPQAGRTDDGRADGSPFRPSVRPAKRCVFSERSTTVEGGEPETPPDDRSITENMSYYFAIIGTQDNPLFEHEFGTSKQGGDGQSRFSDQARHLNQFILHSALDVVEEVQWNNGQLYVQI